LGVGRLLLPEPLYVEMLAQAQAELPNECCGLLAGKVVTTGADAVGEIVARYPLINAADMPTIEYSAEEKNLLAAHRDIDRRELDLLAIYHSHPTSDPVPSRKDRERNFYDLYAMHLIISLRDGEPKMRAWWVTTEDYREAEWQVI